MEEQARRVALRAVAKIALGAGYLASGGCGGRVAPDSLSPVEDVPRSSPAGNSVTVVDADPGQRLACLDSISTSSPASLVSDDALACCTTYVRAHPERPVDGGVSDPSLVNCCTAVIVKARWDDSSLRARCCFGGILGPQEKVWTINYCAPWGPPVPPALDWVAEEMA